MTPFQKALKIKQDKHERRVCIDNGICPDCGASLITMEWDDAYCAYWQECPICTDEKTQRYGFIRSKIKNITVPRAFI